MQFHLSIAMQTHLYTHLHAYMHVDTHQTHPPTSVGHEEENKHAPVSPTPVPMKTGFLLQLKCGGRFHEEWIIEQAQWVFQRNDSNGHRRKTQSAWELENKSKNEYSREEGECGGKEILIVWRRVTTICLAGPEVPTS